MIPERSHNQTQETAVKRGKRELPIEMIRETDAGKNADNQRRQVMVLSKRERQPCEREKRKPLEDVEDHTFVLSERT